jgi:hypothetical protein
MFLISISTIRMSSHTHWYSADEPESTQPPASHHQPLRTSSMPFRLVAFPEGAPDPLEELKHAQEPLLVNLVSGERFHRADSIRQPVAEDFLRPNHPLPAPPIKYDSDQDLPVIEPHCYWHHVDADEHHLSRPERADNINVAQCDMIATTKPLNIIRAGPTHKHSNSVMNMPSHTSHKSDTIASLDTPVPTSVLVSAIGDDMFSPVTGGLHRLESVPVRKRSGMRRLKRFFSLKHHREFGRASG